MKGIIYVAAFTDRLTGRAQAFISRGHSGKVYHLTARSHDRLCRVVNNRASAGQWQVQVWPYARPGWVAEPC